MSSSELALEILTAEELAARLKVKVSWVVDQSNQPGRTTPFQSPKSVATNRHAWDQKFRGVGHPSRR